MVAIVGAAAIMLTVLYLTHGFSATTSIAVAGTLTSLTITAVLSAAATASTRLSGIADETSNYLTITQGDINMRGLLLAGIVIDSLGAGNTPAGELLTGELIAQELVRSAVGTIGLITAVPISTALAALAAARYHRTGDTDADKIAADLHRPSTSRPSEDPWTAFVERHPGWKQGD